MERCSRPMTTDHGPVTTNEPAHLCLWSPSSSRDQAPTTIAILSIFLRDPFAPSRLRGRRYDFRPCYTPATLCYASATKCYTLLHPCYTLTDAGMACKRSGRKHFRLPTLSPMLHSRNHSPLPYHLLSCKLLYCTHLRAHGPPSHPCYM